VCFTKRKTEDNVPEGKTQVLCEKKVTMFFNPSKMAGYNSFSHYFACTQQQ